MFVNVRNIYYQQIPYFASDVLQTFIRKESEGFISKITAINWSFILAIQNFSNKQAYMTLILLTFALAIWYRERERERYVLF